MKAMVLRAFGDADTFEMAEIPVPALRPGQVLVRVMASSVNPVDCLIRQMGPPFAPALPAVLHGDVAGVVEAVAPDVQEFKTGDQVYGCAGGVAGMDGALAEYMAVDAALIAHKPRTLSMREAAAMPLVTITAWQGVYQRAAIDAGDQVLIHAGAGGVGHIAVQLARETGAQVCATVSSDAKADIARRCGAQAVVNYRGERVQAYVDRLTAGTGFHTVFDTVGGGNLASSFEAARLNGTVVTTVALGQFDLSSAHLKGLSLHVIFMLIPLLHGVGRAGHGDILRAAAQRVDDGQLRPLLDVRGFHMRDIGRAHELVESGQAVGKVVVEWN